MRTRKSLVLAIAVTAVSALAAKADPATWAGPYVGVSAGGGVGAQSQAGGLLFLPPTKAPPPPVDGGYGISGAALGGGVGYNWQQERFVFGLEGDGSWLSISGSGTCGMPFAFPHACGGGVDALGTVRGRIGWDISNAVGPFGNVLAYATGGLAVGDVHAWDALLGTSGRSAIAAWTVGGGLEAMVAPHWSVKVEYLHVDLGNQAIFTAATFPEHVATHAEIIRVGLNYHFDIAPPPPVVVRAKY